jgi:GNAT superfamily N-acetyltransferase
MMTIAIQRLNEGVRTTLTAHFIALPMRDRCLRFGTSLAEDAIAAYVNRVNFVRDAVFGIHDDDGRVLVGAAHVAFESDLAEVGLSVLPAHRGRGLGGALFERAMAHARNRSIPRLIMHFLWGNAPIVRIARRFRMSIVAAGGDAHAHLDLPPSSTVSLAAEFATDTFGMYDWARKALGAAWRHQGRAETRMT